MCSPANVTLANLAAAVARASGPSYTWRQIDPLNDQDGGQPGGNMWNGKTLFVIANHFNSKGGDQPLYGRFQPPSHPSETERHQQATVVRGFVGQLHAANAAADVVVLGDLNDFDFSVTTSILTSGGALLDLPATLPVAERYTYVFEGNSQVLDHILLSVALSANPYGYDIVHTNSEVANQISGHDPQVVKLQP